LPRFRAWLGGNGEMLVRYYVAEEAAVLREASFAERETRCRRIETISTLSGGLILLAMLATLIIVQG
jgi:hypothetical protein